MTAYETDRREPTRTPRLGLPPRRPQDGDGSPFPQHSPLITEYAHPTIQHIRNLRYRAFRDDSGQYYAEGLRPFFQAIEHHARIEAVVVSRPLLHHAHAQRLVRRHRQSAIPIIDVAPAVMHQLTLSESSQGIGMVVRQDWNSLESLTTSSELCWVALHRVRSPGNLGTILRTSDAVGGAGAILLGEEIDPYAPASVRATMGSLFSQRLVRATPAALHAWAHLHNYRIVGTAPHAPTEYRTLRFRRPTILLMGEERRGLPPSLQALCDHVVGIPMVGTNDSLNLAIATGVMLYELFNQRRDTQS